MKPLQLIAILSTALYLVPTGAHLFELTHKMAMPPSEYMIVQRVYTGWSLFGIVITVALLATFAHTLLVRADRKAFALSLGAFLGLALTQATFWIFTYPMNMASQFWTLLPEPFEAARQQWEYSHAASAVLTFGSLIAITLSVLLHNQPPTNSDPA